MKVKSQTTTEELHGMIEAQINAAQRVIDNWASGDLAAAVNELEEVAGIARTVLADR